MKLVTHLKIQSSHLALVVALVIGIAFTDRLHAQAAPAPISENPTAILIKSAPPGCQVIDASGRVLMPGLTDAHWHMTMAPNTLDNLEQADLA